MKLDNLDIKKLTVHKIYGKSKNGEPYSDVCKELVNPGAEGMETLHKRINSCLNHKSKFYELDLVDSGKGSFFEIQKPFWGAQLKKFLEVSQQIADKAADSHKNANIPDGLLMVLEAKISTYEAVVVVKAEKSDGFSMAATGLQLIKDIFLSSDKTLYKVGFFIKRDSKNSNAKAYRYFVYDDAFSPAKGDLAHYFYHSFLGLSTEKNSKLQTNKLHRELGKFVSRHIEVSHSSDVLRSIDRAFLDPDRKSINVDDFKSFFPKELHEIYKKEITDDFASSFIKDIAITSSILTKRIALSPETTLLLKNGLNGVITGNTANQTDMTKLKASIDSGKINYSFALIPDVIDTNVKGNEK